MKNVLKIKTYTVKNVLKVLTFAMKNALKILTYVMKKYLNILVKYEFLFYCSWKWQTCSKRQK